MARDVKQEHQGTADAERHTAQPVKAEGGHQIAEFCLCEEPAEDDEHDELRGQPENSCS